MSADACDNLRAVWADMLTAASAISRGHWAEAHRLLVVGEWAMTAAAGSPKTLKVGT